MQKFLALLAVSIGLFGFYFAYERTYPEKCTKRGVRNYVIKELGAMTLVQRQDPVTIRALQIRYIRDNKCNVKKPIEEQS